MSRLSFLQDLLEKSIKELVATKKDMQKSLFTAKMKNASWSLKNTSDIRKMRKDIARVNTLLSHKITNTYGSIVK